SVFSFLSSQRSFGSRGDSFSQSGRVRAGLATEGRAVGRKGLGFSIISLSSASENPAELEIRALEIRDPADIEPVLPHGKRSRLFLALDELGEERRHVDAYALLDHRENGRVEGVQAGVHEKALCGFLVDVLDVLAVEGDHSVGNLEVVLANAKRGL